MKAITGIFARVVCAAAFAAAVLASTTPVSASEPIINRCEVRDVEGTLVCEPVVTLPVIDDDEEVNPEPAPAPAPTTTTVVVPETTVAPAPAPPTTIVVDVNLRPGPGNQSVPPTTAPSLTSPAPVPATPPAPQPVELPEPAAAAADVVEASSADVVHREWAYDPAVELTEAGPGGIVAATPAPHAMPVWVWWAAASTLLAFAVALLYWPRIAARLTKRRS